VFNHGIINVYKEKGYTSHDVVAILRKLTGTKAGHTGTLDPNAEGVLPVCLGRATKLADYIMAENKTYIAEVVPGITTDTGDIKGNVLSCREASVSHSDMEKAVTGFVGEIWQTPPMYSAIKIGGKKLYELARKGKTVERQPRRVLIKEIRVLSREETQTMGCNKADRFFIEVNCSKGTYIRCLCADIGEVLGCGAVMGELARTRSGMFSLENATKIGELKEAAKSGDLTPYILPVDAVLPYPKAVVSAEGLALALNGNTLPVGMIHGVGAVNAGTKYWLYTTDNRVIGLFVPTPEGGRLRPEVML
jgi:tRNA pseudouridine55 synthase